MDKAVKRLKCNFEIESVKQIKYLLVCPNKMTSKLALERSLLDILKTSKRYLNIGAKG